MNWIAPGVINAQQTIQLIRNPHFERGFGCLEPKHPLEGGRIFREGKLQLATDHGEPVWELVQWYSRGSIAKLEPIALPGTHDAVKNGRQVTTRFADVPKLGLAFGVWLT